MQSVGPLLVQFPAHCCPPAPVLSVAWPAHRWGQQCPRPEVVPPDWGLLISRILPPQRAGCSAHTHLSQSPDAWPGCQPSATPPRSPLLTWLTVFRPRAWALDGRGLGWLFSSCQVGPHGARVPCQMTRVGIPRTFLENLKTCVSCAAPEFPSRSELLYSVDLPISCWLW